MSTDSVPHIRVVAAVIEKRGRLLITRRRADDSLGGMWEFPTGEVEENESDGAALRRELHKRVGVSIEVGEEIKHRSSCCDGYVVDLVLYKARLMPGQKPYPIGVEDLRWVPVGELENYRFPDADQRTPQQLLGIRRGARALGTA